MGIVIALIVTFWAGWLIMKSYKPQPVLFLAGMVLMFTAVALGLGTILPAKESTGLVFFDAFEFIKKTLSSRAAGLGLNIMAVGGFARYMDKIGASRAGVFINLVPLFAVLLSWWLLGEKIQGAVMVGGVVLMSGVALTNSPAPRRLGKR